MLLYLALTNHLLGILPSTQPPAHLTESLPNSNQHALLVKQLFKLLLPRTSKVSPKNPTQLMPDALQKQCHWPAACNQWLLLVYTTNVYNNRFIKMLL
jgi:hypothetical protein